MKANTASVHFVYDRLGRQQRIEQELNQASVLTREFAYRDNPGTDGDLQLKTEAIGTESGDLYSKLITRTYQSGATAGRSSGFTIGDENDPDADYAVTYGYDTPGRMYGIQGPGIAPGGVTYDYRLNSDLVQTIAFRDSSLNVKVSANFAYEDHRDLIESVENIRDPNGTPATISKYAYENDAIGRRTLDTRQRTLSASGWLKREALAACQGRTAVANTGAAFADDAFTLWGYNTRSELTSSKRYTGAYDPDPDPGDEITAERRLYNYDPIGNP